MVTREEAVKRAVTARGGVHKLSQLNIDDLCYILCLYRNQVERIIKEKLVTIKNSGGLRVTGKSFLERLEDDEHYYDMLSCIGITEVNHSGAKVTAAEIPEICSAETIKWNTRGYLLENYTCRSENFVYFITDGEYVKIGKANNLQNRINSLQIGNPRKLKLIFAINVRRAKSNKDLESIFHDMYRNYHVLGEWFDILKYIDLKAIIDIFDSPNIIIGDY